MKNSPYDCEHPRTEIRRRTHTDGSTHYVSQCLRCGSAVRYHKSTSQEVHKAARDGIADFDDTIAHDFREAARREYQRRRDEHRRGWLDEYDDYLDSDEWRAKREAILERDDHLCQGCLSREASCVHHRSYMHLGQEFAFELVSLCTQCHERLHDERDA